MIPPNLRLYLDQRDWEDKTKYDSDSIEWLMQPNATENYIGDDSDISDMVAEALSSLTDIDQRMIELIYLEGRTFEYAARAIGLNAKSYAWRKTKQAMQNLEAALRSNAKLMELLKAKYGIGENDNEDEL